MKSLILVLLYVAVLALGWPTELDRRSQAVAGEAARPPSVSLANITRASDDGLKKGRRSLYGPELGTDFPDPSLIYGDGSWKAYSTSANGKNVQIATSGDAISWTLTGADALPNVGSWVQSGQAIWAPDVQKNDAGVYVMYYTAPRIGGTHCIGVATSTAAMGPFAPQSAPLICDDAGGGAIDASGYDDGVHRWIVYKVDGNNLGGASTCHAGGPSGTTYSPTPIMLQQVARDATTLQGGPKTILNNLGAANDGVVEAPSLYGIRGGRGGYILFYSAHCYASDDYDIEYALSATIDGAYGERGVLLRTADGVGIYGPGGLDIDPDGVNAVFHGRTGPNEGGGGVRELYAATLTITPNSISY
ncbi:glycoside hydrolase family 43 protein [Xylariaceae sp. FL0804]|nr:glycoside hydrolase family 43 protein [Xylariaceae sp. FL0804]